MRISALRQAPLLTAVFVAILVSAAAGLLIDSEFEQGFERRTRQELQARINTLVEEIAAQGLNTTEHRDFGAEQVFFLSDGQASSRPMFRQVGIFDEHDVLDGRRSQGNDAEGMNRFYHAS